jgi:hypothetical protein
MPKTGAADGQRPSTELPAGSTMLRGARPRPCHRAAKCPRFGRRASDALDASGAPTASVAAVSVRDSEPRGVFRPSGRGTSVLACMRARKTPEQWSALLDDLSGSGEVVESFCQRRGLRRSTLYWWRWKLGASRRSSGSDTAIRLLPVAVSPGISLDPPAGREIVIHVASLQVHFEPGTDVAYVAALVEALRSRC